jgi:multiphosphoryl transfer protein
MANRVENSQTHTILTAPLSGPLLPLESVPDPVFAGKVVGQGIAIDPTSQVLLAPCDGKVIQLHRAHHAISIETPEGHQVLLHIGIDTVKLGGEGFRPLVENGSTVQRGDKLIEFNSDLIAQKAKSLVTVMLVTSECEIAQTGLDGNQRLATAGKEALLEVRHLTSAANGDAGAKTHSGASISASATVESAELAIENLPTGLHARPAALLANLAKSFSAKVTLTKANSRGETGAKLSANAKSVVAIMGLEIVLGDRVRVSAEGADAQKAMTEIFAFMQNLREEKSSSPVADLSAKPKRSTDENLLIGVGVSPGCAIGRIHLVRAETLSFTENSTLSPEAEETVLDEAMERAKQELSQLMAKVKVKSDAAIFAAHLELLDDPDIQSIAQDLLRRGKSAAFAWNHAISVNADRLATLSNELMAGRANDLRDVGQRVLRCLLGASAIKPQAELPPGSILIAESLTPSETVQIDRTKVVGFCTTSGGATSHVAILARSLGIPAIAGIDSRALDLPDGTEVVLDGERGELRLRPSAELKANIEKIQAENLAHRNEAMINAYLPAKTADGHAVEVAANIGSVADAEQAVAMGADGVGLLRSEFLFLERETAPSESEQLKVYQDIADVLGSRPLVIRTLDVGGDKPLKYLPLEAEENPFLGVRGVRIGLLHPEILREQLRAILRVKSQGKLCVMFPMISTIEEFRAAKAILHEEQERLGANARQDIEVGIMVEVPSVALAADSFAREADFFSVGTNDLTQYTLAMDRGHKSLAKQVDALHPSVLRLIQMAAEAAHRHGKWIGVCGGLASDLKAISVLIGLGIDELSVSIPSIPQVKSTVRESTLRQALTIASATVSAESAPSVRNLLAHSRN